MGESSHSEIEALEDLIATPGWQVFVAHVQTEWGLEAFRRRVRQVLADAGPVSIAEINHTATECERLLAWPYERVRSLRARGEAQAARQTATWPPKGVA